MNKTLLLVLLGPFVLVAAVCVSPFVCVYFLFDRLCDLIEEFKPRTARRKKPASKGAQLGRVLSLIPNRGLQPATNN
jgi:hypothetical protein